MTNMMHIFEMASNNY